MADSTMLDLGPADVHKDGMRPPKPMTAAERRAKKAADREARAKAKQASGDQLRKRSIHVRADLAPGGSLHVRHMSDGRTQVFLPPIPLTTDDVEQ